MSKDLELEAYRQCFASKHHYDVLSWTISGAFVLILSALIMCLVKLDFTAMPNLRLIFGGVGIFLSMLWFSIYERNRFWGEVANETARDIERKNGISGPALEFMKSGREKEVILKNTDEFSKQYVGKNNKLHKATTDRPAINISMHWSIRILIAIAILTFIFLMFSKFKI